MKAEISTEVLIVAGVALALVYLTKRAASAAGEAVNEVWDAAKGALPYVNPADENNVVNQGATAFYQWLTGSNGTIGSDLYDVVNGTSTSTQAEKDAAAEYLRQTQLKIIR